MSRHTVTVDRSGDGQIDMQCAGTAPESVHEIAWAVAGTVLEAADVTRVEIAVEVTA